MRILPHLHFTLVALTLTEWIHILERVTEGVSASARVRLRLMSIFLSWQMFVASELQRRRSGRRPGQDAVWEFKLRMTLPESQRLKL